jgi:hypothetical protein
VLETVHKQDTSEDSRREIRMIPSTFPDPVEVPIEIDGHVYRFQVSASPTEHVIAGQRLWNIIVRRRCRACILIGWFPVSATDPTREETAKMFDEALTNAAQADYDLLSLQAGRALSHNDAAREVSQSRSHAAGLEYIGVSPRTAAELALALDPQGVRPEFGVML